MWRVSLRPPIRAALIECHGDNSGAASYAHQPTPIGKDLVVISEQMSLLVLWAPITLGVTSLDQFITLEMVQAMLRDEVKRAGGISALARELGVLYADSSNCLSGWRLPTKKVLEVLHLRKVMMFERI